MLIKRVDETGKKCFGWLTKLLRAVHQRGVLATASAYGAVGLLWLLSYVYRAWSVVMWRLSPLVDEAQYAERQGACGECGFKELTASGTYCKPCGCAKWKWSELSVKNLRLLHNCPLGKHRGSKKPVGGCKGCGNRGRDGTLVDAKPQTT